ncbi:MAG: aminotransferase class I/II-fold pyridoxal phosphate-dependent enzyme, partial [Bacteroidetes bacterium]
LIIINTPHNPTGAILSAQDMMKLEKLIKDSDTIVLSDEVYEHIIFDGYEHQSIARFPELAKRSIAVYSFGKTFHNTGWKIGYCVAPENIMQEFRKVHQYNVFSCNTPIQYALAEYLQNEEHYLYLSEFYQKKRDLFNQSLETSRFRIHPSAGTYFQLLDYRDISDEKDVDFAVRLTKEYKIASIPVSVFYNKPPEDTFVLRFCFAKEDETLLKAADILCKI